MTLVDTLVDPSSAGVPVVFWLVLFSLAGGVLSVLIAAIFLTLTERTRKALLPDLVSFAIGALLAAAFAAVLPHAAEQHQGDLHALGITMLLGILAFFLLEKVLLWRHSHTGHGEEHDHCEHARQHSAAPYLVLFGDAMHNLVDGVLIGAAFLVDVKLGVLTALAVAAHEIPQELGDFAILLHSGFAPARALALNLLTALTTVAGAVVGYYALPGDWLPYVLAFAAASFVYVAMADLIPSLQKEISRLRTLRQLAWIALGSATILLAHASLH